MGSTPPVTRNHVGTPIGGFTFARRVTGGHPGTGSHTGELANKATKSLILTKGIPQSRWFLSSIGTSQLPAEPLCRGTKRLWLIHLYWDSVSSSAAECQVLRTDSVVKGVFRLLQFLLTEYQCRCGPPVGQRAVKPLEKPEPNPQDCKHEAR